MKVIVTGVTGFIGGEALYQCIQNPQVTEVFTLSRRPISKELSEHPKVTPLILKDFLHYPPELLEQLSGAEACIWAIGSRNVLDANRNFDLDYSQAAITAFGTHLAPQLARHGKKFKFLFTSGFLAEKDQNASLWMIPAARKSRGAAEAASLDFAAKHPDTFETYIVRPGGVLWKDSFFLALIPWVLCNSTIVIDDLACAMVDIVVNAGPSETFRNATLIARGQSVRAKSRAKTD